MDEALHADPGKFGDQEDTMAHRFGLQGIFDNLRDGIVLVRYPAEKIVLWNHASNALFGFSESQAYAMTLGELFHDEAILARARKSGKHNVGEWPGTYQALSYTKIERGDGNPRNVELHFCRVEDAGLGGPLVLIVAREGIENQPGADADHRLRQQRSDRRIIELETGAKDQNLLFGQAAHEFNTPLTIILLQTRLLQAAAQPLPAAQARALSLINHNVHRLAILSQDLMDVTRADSGRLIMDPTRIELAQFVAEEMQSYRELAAQQHVTLEFKPPQGPLEINADRVRLQQVIANLLGNAIKFTPPEGYVTLEVAPGPHESALFSATDTGPGLDPVDLAKLFQPFARIDLPASATKPGTGLGLYLTKRIVEAQGGTIGCTSAGRGQGSTFWFTMPLANSSKSEGRRPAARPARTQAGANQADLATSAPPRKANKLVGEAGQTEST